jgi:hypothetical protein
VKDQRSVIRSQKTEVGRQRTVRHKDRRIKGQEAEISLRPIGAYAPVGGQKTEDGGEKIRRWEDEKRRNV